MRINKGYKINLIKLRNYVMSNDQQNNEDEALTTDVKMYLHEIRGLQLKYNVIGIPLIYPEGPRMKFMRLADSAKELKELKNQYETSQSQRASEIARVSDN